jgi:6,7-dimethyl-8-ribityllumazine synthase
MSLAVPTTPVPDGRAFTIGVAAASYNAELVDALLERVLAELRARNVRDSRVTVVRVPGSNELPVAAQWLARRRGIDVVIALGVLIRGDTIHYELIADATTQAMQRVALDTGVSVINGVVVTENLRQARDRCAGRIDRGAEFAQAALVMAELKKKISR